MKVIDSPFQQPDVSQITPVFVPPNATRSANYELVYINDYGRYERTVAFWDDIDKVWRDTGGIEVTGEIVRHDGIKPT